MSTTGGLTWAHVTKFRSNVLEVVTLPRENISKVAAALTDRAVAYDPVGLDGNGLPTALLVHSDDAFTDAAVGAFADLIGSVDGLAALAHVGFHDHEVGHVHLFRSVGADPQDPAQAPVFVHGLLHDDEGIEMWLFGTHDRLVELVHDLDRYGVLDVQPVETPRGWESVMCTLPGPDAVARYWALEAELTAE